MTRKKSIVEILAIIYISCAIIVPIIIIIITESKNSNNKGGADGFTISAYNVVLDVKEDNTIEVTENITVDFNSQYKHGIYKFTPEWLEYTAKNGKTIKRKSIITNYRAEGEEYTVDTVKKKQRIKIGSASEYVGKGEKTYIIKYTYDMGKDPYKGFDELIFHTYGDYWQTEIKNASIQVNMPKYISSNSVNFYMDKYRKTNANEFVDFYINGTSIYAKFNQEKYLNYQNKEYCSKEMNVDDYGRCKMPSYLEKDLRTSLTIDIELPEGYFVGGSWNYGWGSFIISIIIFIITICNIFIWNKFGKDFPKKSETVEFYPPENYSSAEIGYIYGKQPNKKLTISLIVQLASKGYIKIDEIKEKKKEILITNLLTKPYRQLSINDILPKRIIKIKKLKQEDSKILNKKELVMMKYLFKHGVEKELTTNINQFLKVRDSLVQKGFIQIIYDTEDSVEEVLEKRKEEYELARKAYETELFNYNDKVVNMPALTNLESLVYRRLFESGNSVILSKHTSFYRAFDNVEDELNNKLKDLIDDHIATKKMTKSFILTIIVLFLNIISFFFVEDMSPTWNIIYYSSFACIIINVYLTIIMKRKTEYGVSIIAKVQGFKNFLETVEKDKLESLVLENPHYFYDILPYTYVLNISKKWIEKFENIPMPKINMGTYDFNSFNSFNNLYKDISYPEPVKLTSSSSSSSRGCSSCGGGCSSCGGGCSSCGGGGSW